MEDPLPTPLINSGRLISSLRAAEAWLLCSLRLVAASYRGHVSLTVCEQGFIAAHIPLPVCSAFKAAIDIIAVSMRCQLDFRQPDDYEISADEERFLGTVRALQNNDEFSAARFLRPWLPPAAVRLVLAHLDTLASGMNLVGLRLAKLHHPACPMYALAQRRLSELDNGFEAIPQPVWLN
jgi:hypothetical protein